MRHIFQCHIGHFREIISFSFHVAMCLGVNAHAFAHMCS